MKLHVHSDLRTDLGLVVRKPAFCICENKDADQRSFADQRLCFFYTASITPLLPKPLDIFCGRTDLFVSDLVGNPEDWFSHNEAHLIQYCQIVTKLRSKKYEKVDRCTL